MILLVGVNHPVSQEDLVSIWEPAHSLVEDALSGAEIVPSPSGSGYRLSASLPLVGAGASPQLASSPLAFAQSFFCGWARLCLKAFCRKVLSLSLSLSLSPLWLSYSLCCYLTLAPSDCLQGIQAWFLP